MIAPSDLNRIPRWMPERQSEELSRYATRELGGAVFELHPASQTPTGVRGFRAWFAARVRTAPRPAAVAPPLRPGLAAVHFSGETVRSAGKTAGASNLPAAASVLFATPSKGMDADELCTCEL